jgi:hypothetical protein
MTKLEKLINNAALVWYRLAVWPTHRLVWDVLVPAGAWLLSAVTNRDVEWVRPHCTLAAPVPFHMPEPTPEQIADIVRLGFKRIADGHKELSPAQITYMVERGLLPPMASNAIVLCDIKVDEAEALA